MLVDGIEFSDDKTLQGRTLSYSDTQRYRAGANDLQLPVKAPNGTTARTNQQGGQMAHDVDEAGANKHVNYEPSRQGGLVEAPRPGRDDHQWVEGHLGRYQTTRTQDDYAEGGARWRSFEAWERDDLVANLAEDMKACPPEIALRMVWHFRHCDPDYGTRVHAAAG